MPKMKAYASFADWKKDQSAKNKKLIGALQRVIRATAPHLCTTVKWGQGSFLEGDVPKLYIHAAADHVQLGFYRGATLKDPHRLLSGNGKYVRHLKVTTAGDIDQEALPDLIRQVVE